MSAVKTSTDSQNDLDASTLNMLMVEIDLEQIVHDLEETPGGERSHRHEAEAPPNDTSAVPASDRRGATRLSSAVIGDSVQVSVPRATRTVVVNVSDSGVLVDTNCQLSPGRSTDVFVKLEGERQALRATVVRSSVHSLMLDDVVYRSALHFERLIGLSAHVARR